MSKKGVPRGCAYDEKSLIEITRRFNIQKFNAGENGEIYYRKMNDWFLKDMDVITDAGQFTVEDGNILFWIDGCEFIRFLIIAFNRRTGEYAGLNNAFTQHRPKGSTKMTHSQMKKARAIEINTIIARFENRAEHLGYLI